MDNSKYGMSRKYSEMKHKQYSEIPIIRTPMILISEIVNRSH